MSQPVEIVIREAGPGDREQRVSLWNQCAQAEEVVYAPMDASEFARTLERDGAVFLVAWVEGTFAGWIQGMTDPASPDVGYLTVVLVAPSFRRQGVGTALLHALEERLRALGKRLLVCSGNNPVHLAWRVPGTPGHDHNNAPGVDEGCAGYPFLLHCGLEAKVHEVSMYRALSDYRWPEQMDEITERLRREGIEVGPYDGVSDLEFDGMCDRVGSEYWRHVLRCELEAWRTGQPNGDETLWVDGKRPAGPRPLLLAVHDGHIVGFTGPVDVQQSGRGWFTGICVDPLYGRRSIGALLFHMLLRAFVQAGATFTTLFTGAENHAQQIYLRAGLSVVRAFAVMAKPLVDDAVYDQVHF